MPRRPVVAPDEPRWLRPGEPPRTAAVRHPGIASRWQPPPRITGVLLAFASGTLVSALAFELFRHAVGAGRLAPAGLGLLAGLATLALSDEAG
jgi:hypothetical protein